MELEKILRLDDLFSLPKTQDVLGAVLEDPRLVKEGVWVEFGVAGGQSLRRIAEHRGFATLWGVDSFRGLPEDWIESHPKGTFAQSSIALPPEGVNLLVGHFEEVVWNFFPSEVITFVHIDSDLYESAKTILNWLSGGNVAFGEFSIILFDELHGYEGWEKHEAKALAEWLEDTGFQHEWLYCAPPEGGQAALRIL